MFESFTDRARRAVVLAQEETRRLNHSHIGTEHLLLGLLNDGQGIASECSRRVDGHGPFFGAYASVNPFFVGAASVLDAERPKNRPR
jgi:hypothetical protein